MKKALIIASVPSMIEQFNMNNIKILQELGYQVDVATNFQNGGNISKERTVEFKKELDNISVGCYNIPFARNPFSLSNIKAYKEIKKIVSEDKHYNIIHMHSPIGGVCGRIACRKLSRNDLNVIYTAHGFHFYKGAPILNWLLYYPVEKILSKYTDYLITINKEDYELATRKFNAKNTKLVHGIGIDVSKFDIELGEEEKRKKREEIGLKEEDFVIIQVGELNKNKNQIMLIETMKELKQDNRIKVLFAGIGKLAEEYKELIIKYNLQNNVRILGYRRDIPELLKISNCLVSLSYREGLGINAVEGMLAKIPVILSKNRGHNELNIDKEYMVGINDTEKLKEIILELKDRCVPEKIIEENYIKAQKFSAENVNNDMKSIYKECEG